MKSPFIESVRADIRLRGYSIRTEKSYLGWVKRFIFYHRKRHPGNMGAKEVTEFLSYLALQRNVSPSTQNQAFNALMYFYRHVLETPIEDLHGAVRAKKKQKMSVVLTKDEIRSVLKDVRTTQIVALTHPCVRDTWTSCPSYTHVLNRGGTKSRRFRRCGGESVGFCHSCRLA